MGQLMAQMQVGLAVQVEQKGWLLAQLTELEQVGLQLVQVFPIYEIILFRQYILNQLNLEVKV